MSTWWCVYAFRKSECTTIEGFNSICCGGLMAALGWVCSSVRSA